MFGFLDKIDRKHMGIFAAGVLFGTAGIKILSGRDDKRVYTHGAAAALRANDFCMKTAAVQENAEDIYAEAVQINEERARQEAEQVISDEEDWEEETVSERKDISGEDSI